MSCEHEWTESIRCSRCGQAVESKAEGMTALSRELDEAVGLLKLVHADWNQPDLWATLVRRYLEKIGAES